MSCRAAIWISGQTAVGKSAIAIAVAERLKGEIITVDSMQVYRGMDIGTAKPTKEERARVRHHLVDVVNVSQSFNVAEYVQEAARALEGVRQRGACAVYCGGTGLYFRALREGLQVGVSPDSELRAELAKRETASLAEELRERDPATYAGVDLQNRRRLVRALEVVLLSRHPVAEGPDSREGQLPAAETLRPMLVFTRAADDLNRRIEGRIEQMFADGLIEETEGLLRQGLAENPTAMQAIGYRQVVDFLRGNATLESTKAQVLHRTRQYARRQRTWFRHQMEPVWWTIPADESAESTADKVCHWLQNEAEPRPYSE